VTSKEYITHYQELSCPLDPRLMNLSQDLSQAPEFWEILEMIHPENGNFIATEENSRLARTSSVIVNVNFGHRRGARRFCDGGEMTKTAQRPTKHGRTRRNPTEDFPFFRKH